jgi:hypothetical protein
MKLLNEKEVAAMLSVSPIMLRKQRCIGQTPGGAPVVPFVKMGKRVRYVEADVIQYVENLREVSAQ